MGCAPELGSDFGLRPTYEPPLPAHSPGRVPRASARIDEAALHAYLCLSHIPHPLSIYAGHRRVDPLPTGWVSPDMEIGEAQIESLLHRSVEARLPKDSRDPVGIWLSGGLDSALVCALLDRMGARGIAFTLDFGPPWDGELPVARAIAEHVGFPLRVVDARPAAIAAALDGAYSSLPEPFGDPVVPPLHLLAQATAREARFVFNGEGGDQLFGGWANKPMVASSTYGIEDETNEYLRTYHRFHGATDLLYTPRQRERVAGCEVANHIRPHLDPSTHPLLVHRLRAANLALKGAQNIAPRCGAIAGAAGLELRAPLLDRALADATFALPTESFLEGAVEKPLLRRIARRYLPPEIVDLPKRGMGAPAAHWSRAAPETLKRVRAALSPLRLRREGRFDSKFVASLLEGVDGGSEGFRPRRAAEKVWCLVAWELWRTSHGLD
ncbi:MAG: asparagine synthetase B family protein [Armatimonadota bacterium]